MFDKRFEVFFADTPESKRWHYRLRYQVYCKDTHFEDPICHPDGLERDEYDSVSAHFLVRSRETGEWVGAMRLVFGLLPELPLAKYGQFSTEFLRRPRQLYAEVSRLCVIEKYRGRQMRQVVMRRREADSRVVNIAERRREPEIVLGLIRAAHAYVEERGVRQGFFFVSDPLARILKRIPLNINAAGPASYHRGKRRPYFWDTDSLTASLAGEAPAVAEMFQRKPAFRSARTLQLEPLVANQA